MKKRDKIINKQNAISHLSSMRSERRNTHTLQIRKVKRNQILAVKRRMNSNALNGNRTSKSQENTNLSSEDLRQLCIEYCKVANSGGIQKVNLLNSLQLYVSSVNADIAIINALLTSRQDGSVENGNMSGNEIEISRSLPMALAQALASTLLSSVDNSSSHMYTFEEQMDAVRIITNLAAIESSFSSFSLSSVGPNIHDSKGNGDDIDYSYYGSSSLSLTELGWCGVLLLSNAVSALVQVVSQFTTVIQKSQSFPSPSIIALCEQCVWAIGNLAGDSQKARENLSKLGALPPLVQCLVYSFRTRHSQQETQSKHTDMFGLCRNAAWALSNMARGAETSALPFLTAFSPSESGSVQQQNQQLLEHINNRQNCLLSSKIFADILLAPDIMNFSSDSQHVCTTHANELKSRNWMEVGFETCWILAFLTAREHEAVQFLCREFQDGHLSTSLICNALSHCFAVIVNCLTNSSSQVDINGANNHKNCVLRTFIPCIRAIGNIATACDGTFVPLLLTATSPNHNQTILQSIAQMLHFTISPSAHSSSSNSYDFTSLALETTWTAGALLCDLPNYKSTNSDTMFSQNHQGRLNNSVIQTLIQPLCNIVVSPNTKLDLKKEALSALWNAVAPSPNLSSSHLNLFSSSPIKIEMNTCSLQILQQISQTPKMIKILVGFLKIPDDDIIFFTLRLVNALIRIADGTLSEIPKGYSQLKIDFEEEGIIDALETICDNTSCQYYGGQQKQGYTISKNADIAADLIDDIFADEYYDKEADEDTFMNKGSEFSDAVKNIQSNSTSSNFSFDFTKNNEQSIKFDSSFGFHSVSKNTLPGHDNRGSGRGRGRGANIPAWMK